MTKRYRDQPWTETASFNPQAGMMVLFGRVWPYARKAAAVSGSAALVVWLVSAVLGQL